MSIALEANRRRRSNVESGERLASTLLGAALLVQGIRRRSPLGLGLAAAGGALLTRGYSGRCLLYDAFGKHELAFRRPVRIVEVMQVHALPGEAYRLWRDLAGLPRFLQHVESVSERGERSHWVARFSGLPRLEWDAELVRDEAARAIAWRSLPGSTLEGAGSVSLFDLGTRGTGLRVEIAYCAPPGLLAAPLARVFSAVTEREVREDVRRFKRLLEAGELPTTERKASPAVLALRAAG